LPIVPIALVTGPLEDAQVTALTLKAAGFEGFAAEPDGADVPENLRQVDCYVQLPVDPPCADDDALAWAHSVVAHALSVRFDAAAQVAPLLAAKARVVLVTNPTDGTPTFDTNLVRPLIEAIIADHGGHDVQVAVITGLRTPEQIIAAARTQPPAWTAYPRIEPHLPFSAWRNEIICQSSLDS
jgi:non-ribosomal peptide synthetase component F